mgnify:CR=1 FL=1
MSRPVRARGLKLPIYSAAKYRVLVAPRAGAWIETRSAVLSISGVSVAPRAGAWIETDCIENAASWVLCRAPCGRVD